MNGVKEDTPRASSRPHASPRSRVLWFVGAAVLLAGGVLFVARPELNAQVMGPQPFAAPPASGGGSSPRSRASVTGIRPSLRTAVPTATEPIADVRIEGNRTIPATAIAKYIKTRPGRPATQKQIREDVRALYGTRWFFSIEPRMTEAEGGPVLVFRVVERPIVRSVEFRGASKKRQKWLAAETGLKVGSPFDPSANRESVRRIEQFYKEKGHYFAKCELLKGGNQGDREVIFEIEEGPKVRVTNHRFVGNEFVGDGVLRLSLQTKAAWFWVLGGQYDPSTLPNDISALKQYYFGLGFFDAQIGYREIFSDDKSSVTVEYKIAEGPRYKVRNIEIQGAEVVEPAEITADLTLERGEFFNERKLNKDIAVTRAKYGDLGRIFAKVEAIPRYLDSPGEVDLIYRIDEDRPYRIRRINVNIAGDHPYTKPQVALNYLGLAPGDLANPDKIDFSRRRLAGIRVFDSKPGTSPEVNITQVPENQMYAVNDVFRGQQNDAFVPRLAETDEPVRAPLPPVQRGESGTPRSRPSYPVRTASGLPGGHAHHVEHAGHTRPTARPQFLRDVIPASPTTPSHFTSDLDRLRREALRDEAHGERESRDQLVPTSGYVPLEPGTVFRGQDSAPDFGNEPPPGDIQLAQGRGLDTFTPNDYKYDNDPSNGVFGDSPFAPPGSVPYIVPREVAPGLVDLDYTLNEAQTGRLMFGVGVNSDAGVVGTISLQEDNFDLFNVPRSWSDFGNGAFRGGGQRLRIEAVPGNVVSRYLVSWTDPFIFGSNYSLSLTGFFFNRFYRDWDEQRGGGRVSVGRVLGTNWSGTMTYRLEQIDVENPSTLLSPTLVAAVGTNLLQSIALGLAHDTRDSPFLPSEGHHYEAKIEQAFGDFDFTKGTLEARHYYTTYSRADGRGRHVLTAGGELGLASDDTPLVERFYAGGFQTFRGFDFRGVSPIEAGVRTGGSWSALGSVEYKVPITADENLAVVAFTDFGTIENTAGFQNFRLAVGTGLRITVPAMGPVPLAFDFAIPLIDEDFDDERIFSFYIGIQR